MTRIPAAHPLVRRPVLDLHKLQCTMKYILICLIIFSGLGLITTFFDFTAKPSPPEKHEVYAQLTGGAVDLRRDVAKELRNILNELTRAKEYKRPPDTHSLLALERSLGQLDPRLLPQESFDVNFQEKQLTADNKTASWLSGDYLEACPEIYVGTKDKNPYESFQAHCNNKISPRKLVTVLVDGTDLSESRLDSLLHIIDDSYKGMKILVATVSRLQIRLTEKIEGAQSVRVTSSTPPAVRWARLIRRVETKYILVGLHLVSFSRYTDIDRLIRAYRQVPYVSYVGGASRNTSGNWMVECYQSRMKLYGLSIREGYSSSSYECMYCDSLGGPFLTTSYMFSTTPLDETLPESVVFFDWFLRVRANGGHGLVCPDVLFFISSSATVQWLRSGAWGVISAKWGVTDIHLPGRVSYHFTCQEAKLDCKNIPEYLVLPPCCLSFMSHALREAVAVLGRYNIKVHVTNTTLVGGVKGGLQPWERKSHLSTKEHPEKVQKLFIDLQEAGFTAERKEEGENSFYHLYGYDHTIVLHTLSENVKDHLPSDQRSIRTLIRLGGGWVPGPSNPGLYARGLAGRGSLQHHPQNGRWPKCKDFSHHSCMDYLPLDGSWTKLR